MTAYCFSDRPARSPRTRLCALCPSIHSLCHWYSSMNASYPARRRLSPQGSTIAFHSVLIRHGTRGYQSQKHIHIPISNSSLLQPDFPTSEPYPWYSETYHPHSKLSFLVKVRMQGQLPQCTERFAGRLQSCRMQLQNLIEPMTCEYNDMNAFF